jgi:hypothetical protein
MIFNNLQTLYETYKQRYASEPYKFIIPSSIIYKLKLSKSFTKKDLRNFGEKEKMSKQIRHPFPIKRMEKEN